MLMIKLIGRAQAVRPRIQSRQVKRLDQIVKKMLIPMWWPKTSVALMKVVLHTYRIGSSLQGGVEVTHQQQSMSGG